MSTTQELIERLSALASGREPWSHVKAVGAIVEAADRLASLSAELDALKAEVERLRGALEPFAKGANAFDTITPGGSGRPCPDAATYCEGAEVTVGDFRRARAVLGGGG